MKDYEFTKIELEIIEFVAQGFNNQEISKRMNYSIYAIKSHLEKIYRKTGINNRVLLAVMYFKTFKQ